MRGIKKKHHSWFVSFMPRDNYNSQLQTNFKNDTIIPPKTHIWKILNPLCFRKYIIWNQIDPEFTLSEKYTTSKKGECSIMGEFHDTICLVDFKYLAGRFYGLQCRIANKIHSEPLRRSCWKFCNFISRLLGRWFFREIQILQCVFGE